MRLSDSLLHQESRAALEAMCRGPARARWGKHKVLELHAIVGLLATDIRSPLSRDSNCWSKCNFVSGVPSKCRSPPGHRKNKHGQRWKRAEIERSGSLQTKTAMCRDTWQASGPSCLSAKDLRGQQQRTQTEGRVAPSTRQLLVQQQDTGGAKATADEPR